MSPEHILLKINAFVTYEFTGYVEEFVPTYEGLYQLELWGGQGGNATFTKDGIEDKNQGGRGGYSKGYIHLERNEKIFICVGEKGVSATSPNTSLRSSFNGGGQSFKWFNVYNAGGGGATHIAKVNRGVLKNYLDFKSDVILVAAGGGGAASHIYNETAVINGGYGGGLEGGEGSQQPNKDGSYGFGGTQTSGGTSFTWTYDKPEDGSFGQGGKGATIGGTGGGAGWYGGAGGGVWGGAGGGSSYIDGCKNFEYKSLTYTPETKEDINLGNGLVKITALDIIRYSFPVKQNAYFLKRKLFILSFNLLFISCC